MTQLDEIRNLIRQNHRRLQVMLEQQARFGLYTPAYIVLEIEDIQTEIERLKAELEIFANDPDTLAERIDQQRQRIVQGLVEIRRQSTTSSIEHKMVQVVGRSPLGAVDHFKDRIRELQAIGKLLAEPSTRLVSVIGHGGMGKTALVSKILRDLEQHRWPHTDQNIPLDGIVYQSTRTTGINLERLFLDCAKMLGGNLERDLNETWTNPRLSNEGKISQLIAALKNGQYVILLDNLEDLLDSGGHLVDKELQQFFDQSMTHAHGARLIVTSRVALMFRREVMRNDHQVKLLEGLPIEDGVTLLRELDPNGDLGLRDAPHKELAQAVSLVHGVPRALEVLAGILANDPFASLGEVIKQFYTQEGVVETLIEESYRRLDEHAKRVIDALAVYRRPVPTLAVDYLLEPFVPGLDVPAIVRRLTHTNIASVDRTSKTIILHPIDQDYAYSQLPEEETRDVGYTRQALERRAADYFVQLRSPKESWRSINDLAPQLSEFEHRIRAGDYEDACEILIGLDYDYLIRWGHYGRVVEMHERLLGHLESIDLQSANFGGLGRAYRYLGQLESTIPLYEQAIASAKQAGDKEGESTWIGNLGNTYRELGYIQEAILYYEQATELARGTREHRGEDLWLGYVGVCYRQLGQIERGLEYHEQALALAREINDRWEEGGALGDMGAAFLALGQVQRAIELHEQALDIARELGVRRHEYIWLEYLGHEHYALGQLEAAERFFEEALTIARDIGHRLGVSYQLLSLCRISLSSANIAKAREYRNEAQGLKVNETEYEIAMVAGIVDLFENRSSARALFLEAIVFCQTMLEKSGEVYRPRYILATALVGQAVADSEWHQAEKRQKLLMPAVEEFNRARRSCSALGVIADVLRDIGLIQSAGVEGLEIIIDLLRTIPSPD